jgi:hypothetical protein
LGAGRVGGEGWGVEEVVVWVKDFFDCNVGYFRLLCLMFLVPFIFVSGVVVFPGWAWSEKFPRRASYISAVVSRLEAVEAFKLTIA